MRLLIIDERPEDRERVVRVLARAFDDVEPVVAADPDTVEQALADASLDLVVTEHALSWTDGLEVLAQVQTRRPGVPVIMVTGAGSERLAVAGMKAGLTDYVPKHDLAHLPDAVRQALAAGDGLPCREEAAARQAAEEARRETQLNLSHVLRLGRMGSWRLDVRRDVLVWSDETYDLFGIPRGTPLTYERFLEAVHPDDREAVDEAWQVCLRGASYGLEHRILVGDEVRWVRERAFLEFDDDGELLDGFGVVQDITGRKRAEEERERLLSEVRRQAAVQDAIVEALPDGLLFLNAQGDIVRMNAAAERVLGYTREMRTMPLARRVRLIGMQRQDGGDMGDLADFPPARALKGETALGHIVSWITEGARHWFSVSAAPVRMPGDAEVAGAVATFTDVTPLLEAQQQLEDVNVELEEQAAELEEQAEELISQNEMLQQTTERLEAEQARLQAVLEALPVGVMVADDGGSLVRMNDLACDVWADPSEPATCADAYVDHRGWWAGSGEPLDLHDWPLMRALSSGKRVTGKAIDIERLDGTRTTILNSAAPIRGTDGAVIGAVAITQDISELARLRRDLQRERDLLQILYDVVPVMFVTYDAELREVAFSKHVERVTGWTAEDTAERSLLELAFSYPADRQEMKALLRSLELGFRDFQMVTKSGAAIETSWAAVEVPGGRRVAIGIDITPRKRAEAERERLLAENRHQRQMLERLVEAAPAGIALVRCPDYTFEVVNAAYQAIPGVPGTQMVGRTFAEVFPGVVEQGGMDLLDDARTTGKTQTRRESPMVVAPGRDVTYWDATAVPLRDAKGQVAEVLLLVHDVTDVVTSRQQLQEANETLEDQAAELEELAEELRSQNEELHHLTDHLAAEHARIRGVLAAIPADVVIADADGHLIETTETLSQTWQEVLSDDTRRIDFAALNARRADSGEPLDPDDWALNRALRRGETTTGEVIDIERRDGVRVTILKSAAPVLDEGGDVIGAVAVAQDISERRAIERALAQRTQELEALNQTNEMLLQEVNHRVKNTLSAILGLIFAEKRHLSWVGTPQVAEALDDLAERVRSLAAAHSMLSSTGWRPLEVDELAGEVIGATAPAVDDAEMLVVDVAPSHVRVTPEQAHNLALVIGELVTNTVKYGHNNEGVQIGVDIALDDGQVRLTYRDRGPGYPEPVLAGEQRSVGLSLLDTIVKISLRGSWELRNDGGAVTEVRFPADSELNEATPDE